MPAAPVVVGVVTALGVVGIATVLALAYTRSFGVLNQATYLLDPLHRAVPALFDRDWFISETPPYLPAFGWLAQWLFWVDPEGPVAVVAAHVVVMVAIYAAIYGLGTAVCDDLRVYVIVASVIAMTMGRTLGGNYLITGYLQPSSLATLGWVVAMAALVRRRHLACGVALAFAGLMHANFLVLGVGLFTLTLLAGRDATRGDVLRLLVPQLAVLGYTLPDLLAASGPSEAAVRIFVEFHAPTHYAPGRLARHLPELVTWQIAAWAVLPLLGGSGAARVLWRFSLLSLAIAVVTTFVMMIPSLTWITQVRWTRMTPFGQLACQVLIAGALIRYATGPAVSLARRGWVAAGVALGIVGWCWRLFRMGLRELAIGAGVVLAIVVVPHRAARYAATGTAVALLVIALWRSPRGAELTASPAASPGEIAMAAWIRRETPVDALFLTPPWLQRFRLMARRAIVVDTKSPPLRPDLLVAWYRRMCAVVQVDDAKNYQWIEARWAELTPDQRVAVARSFAAEYIVVTADIALPWEPAYKNDEYAVYRTPGV